MESSSDLDVTEDWACVSYITSVDQYVAFQEYWWFKTRRGRRRRLVRAVSHSSILALLLWLMLQDIWGARNALVFAAAACAMVFPVYMGRFGSLDRRWWRWRIARRVDPASLDEAVTLCAAREGLKVKAERGEVSVEWDKVFQVVSDAKGIAIVLWNDMGWAVPQTAFANAEARSQFEGAIDRYRAAASTGVPGSRV